jgi:hypothetical protein
MGRLVKFWNAISFCGKKGKAGADLRHPHVSQE